METKICKKCHLEKPITEFNKHRGECKACVKEYNRKYHQENREKIAEKKKIYNETHKEQIAEMYHNYYLNNMEKKKSSLIKMKKAIVNKIIHSSVVDGPGNRAAIFLQGCKHQGVSLFWQLLTGFCEGLGEDRA